MRMILTKQLFKLFCVLLVMVGVFNIMYIYTIRSSTNIPKEEKIFESGFTPNKTDQKVSWEDYDFIYYERTRVGPGENGIAYIEEDPEQIKKNEEWMKKEGFDVELSNKISVTRSLPDLRPEVCQRRKYLQNLPNVSVIITFHNELSSTLKRCIHSNYNRSPKSLLHEIILVNDKSTFTDLFEPLRKYVKQVFGLKVKIIENGERQGLIKARMTGARAASGEVIIFLDSHMEVFNSWLPPLLDVIVTNPSFASVPVISGIDAKTFQPAHVGYGYRGMFDWNFRYQWFPLRPQDKPFEAAPYELPSMTGGAYAIRREQFFHLGGYDENLQIWNGENYELSIKLWLCGGGIYEVPCSRVAHLTKKHSAHRHAENATDFVGRNLKRVAEVWLDDYKQYFYRGEPSRYFKLDPGDLTKQFEKKKSLNCKPFKHYLDVVAPDMLMYYPLEPQHFAAGKIQSRANLKCLGILNGHFAQSVALVNCTRGVGVDFELTLEKTIRYNDTNDQCLTSTNLTFTNCHHQRGTQHWKFDLETRQIRNPLLKKCLEANGENLVFMGDCDVENIEQQWKWTFENRTALNDWDRNGIAI